MRQRRYNPPKHVRQTTYYSPEHGEDRDGVVIERNGNLVYIEDGVTKERDWVTRNEVKEGR